MELTKETLIEIKRAAINGITAEQEHRLRMMYINLADACEEVIDWLEDAEESACCEEEE